MYYLDFLRVKCLSYTDKSVVSVKAGSSGGVGSGSGSGSNKVAITVTAATQSVPVTVTPLLSVVAMATTVPANPTTEPVTVASSTLPAVLVTVGTEEVKEAVEVEVDQKDENTGEIMGQNYNLF